MLSFFSSNKIVLLLRHDEWIKLDRIIERKDSTNANTLFQQHPRRTNQVNTIRQHHLDSTNSPSSNEQSIQPQISTSLIVSSTSSSTLVDEDEQSKVLKSMAMERNKVEESDIDDNSQGQSESKSCFLSLLVLILCIRSLESCGNNIFHYGR